MIRSLSPPGELHADGDGRKEAAMEAEFAGIHTGMEISVAGILLRWKNISRGLPAEMKTHQL